MTLQLKTLLPLPEDLSYFPAPTKGKRAHNSNLGWGGSKHSLPVSLGIVHRWHRYPYKFSVLDLHTSSFLTAPTLSEH